MHRIYCVTGGMLRSMKDPKRVAAGKKAAAARWGDKRVVRLNELTPAQRRLVLALIEAMEESNAEGNR